MYYSENLDAFWYLYWVPWGSASANEDNAPAMHVLLLGQRKLWWPICCAPPGSSFLVLLCFCTCVMPPEDTTADSFFDRGSYFCEKMQASLQSWKEKWKAGSADKGTVLAWLLALVSFLSVVPWVGAVVSVALGKRQAQLLLFLQTRLDLVSLPTTTCCLVGKGSLQ